MSHTTIAYILAGFFGLNVIVTVSQVGKPRKPTEASGAAFAVIIYGLLIWAALVLR